MLSYWEQKHFLTYDYAIVGSGIVGLFCALFLRENNPEAKIVVLERGILPTGASTKNAGFSCFGSIAELEDDTSSLSLEAIQSIVQLRWEGFHLMREKLGVEAMGYIGTGSYELIQYKEEDLVSKIDFWNDALMPIFGRRAFQENQSLLSRFGLNTNTFSTIITNPLEGQIHPGRLMKSLLDMVRNCNIDMYTGANVTKIDQEGDYNIIAIDDCLKSTQFKALKVGVCTNAFVKDLVDEELDIQPGRGQVLITEPLKKVPFRGVFHADKGYLYFRNVGRRILIGGGRNIDYKTEATDAFEANDMIIEYLTTYLRDEINVDAKIEMNWTGIMAFGATKEPIIKDCGNGIYVGAKLGGMGVAIGSKVAQQLAQLMC